MAKNRQNFPHHSQAEAKDSFGFLLEHSHDKEETIGYFLYRALWANIIFPYTFEPTTVVEWPFSSPCSYNYRWKR